MQQPYGEIKNAEIRLPEIRTYIYETVGKEIEDFGYKFRKSDFTFKKKQGKDTVQFIFIFHDYNPVNYDTSFSFNVFNSSIQEIKRHVVFDEFLGPKDWTSLLIPLGDFVESEKDKEIKWRSYYNCYLSTRKELFDAAEQMRDLLKKEILPLCETLFTIEGINDLFANRGIQWSVSSLSVNDMAADLISAKLSGKRDYHKVHKEIMAELKPMLSNGYHESAWGAIEV
jgi:hypothetical protein